MIWVSRRVQTIHEECYSSVLDSCGHQQDIDRSWRDLAKPEKILAVPTAGGVFKIITESHGIASAVTYEADRNQQLTIEEPEETSAELPSDGVTEAMPVNHSTTSAVSLETDGTYED
jgi:hypothetical protein